MVKLFANMHNPKVVEIRKQAIEEGDKVGVGYGYECDDCVDNDNCPYAFDPYNQNSD